MYLLVSSRQDIHDCDFIEIKCYLFKCWFMKLLHISQTKNTYHDHPEFWFCFKEDLSCFLCVQRVAWFFWWECPKVCKLKKCVSNKKWNFLVHGRPVGLPLVRVFNHNLFQLTSVFIFYLQTYYWVVIGIYC